MQQPAQLHVVISRAALSCQLTRSRSLQCTAATRESSGLGHSSCAWGCALPLPGAFAATAAAVGSTAGCSSSAAKAAREGVRSCSWAPNTCTGWRGGGQAGGGEEAGERSEAAREVGHAQSRGMRLGPHPATSAVPAGVPCSASDWLAGWVGTCKNSRTTASSAPAGPSGTAVTAGTSATQASPPRCRLVPGTAPPALLCTARGWASCRVWRGGTGGGGGPAGQSASQPGPSPAPESQGP